MHELRIARDLSDIVLETAAANKLIKVSHVNVVFGSLVQVVRETFEFAFSECVKGTVADGSFLHIEILPVRFRCGNCGKEESFERDLKGCSGCGSPGLELLQGNELYIKSIEGE